MKNRTYRKVILVQIRRTNTFKVLTGFLLTRAHNANRWTLRVHGMDTDGNAFCSTRSGETYESIAAETFRDIDVLRDSGNWALMGRATPTILKADLRRRNYTVNIQPFPNDPLGRPLAAFIESSLGECQDLPWRTIRAKFPYTKPVPPRTTPARTAEAIPRVLSVEAIESLLGLGLSSRRVGQVVEDQGVGFEMTEQIRRRLRRAGADDTAITTIELAALEVTRKRLEAERSGVAKTPRPPEVEPVPRTVVDGMVEVAAGEFWMGCNTREDRECGWAEKPGRLVYVDRFVIDRTEVTVGQYRRCVEGGQCARPGSGRACTWGRTREREAHPINCVTRKQARAYCKSGGKRLPTEAEWEKAARGTQGWVYPWGNSWAVGRANTEGKEDGYARAGPVGSFSRGASPYGPVDMIGNVSEWVSDWFDGGYYRTAPNRNPIGPATGRLGTVRGGSWYDDMKYARASNRYWNSLEYQSVYVGFRCVRELP